MKAKKVISLVTAILVVISMMIMPVSAEIDASKAVFAFDNATVKAGSEVSVVLKATASVSLVGLEVTYDSDKLTYVSFEGKEAFAETGKETGKVTIERAETSAANFDNS